MTSMDVSLSYPVSKFEADNSLTNPEVIEKYQLAADIVNAVLPMVVDKVAVGISVNDLCQFGDDLIEFSTKNMHKTSERGIAMPTCVSVNSIVQYFSPLAENDYNLKPGDVVKIELGAHVDGYIGTSATTTVVNDNTQNPITGKAADVVCATYFAYEVATRMLRPGIKASEITKAITEIAHYFRCQPVEGTFSSPMKRFVLRAGKDIENRFLDELILQDLEKYDFEVEANQVYQINIVLSTGNGQVKNTEYKPFVYQRDVNKSYQLKMKSARLAYAEVNANHTVFPFAMRALSSNTSRLGLTSLLHHELVTAHPVMRTKVSSDLCAQFKGTVMVTAEGPVRNSLPINLPFVHSQYQIPDNTTAAAVLSTGSVKEIRKSKFAVSSDVTFGEHREVKEDTEMEE